MRRPGRGLGAAALAAGTLIVLLGSPTAAAPDEARGAVIPRVACAKAPRFSYALYLPPSYDPKQKWPVVFCFAPDGRGIEPVARMQEAAERFGLVVVGSNDSRNGPWDRVDAAQRALWREVNAKFAIDPRRAYALGFSGGSRAALYLALDHEKNFAGVVSCGALLTDRAPLPKRLAVAVFGLVGADDLARDEYEAVMPVLRERGARAWLEVFKGGHEWPPAALLTRAMEFMQLQAGRTGLAPRDEAFERRILTDWRERAVALDGPGTKSRAFALYRQLALLFPGDPASPDATAAARLAADEETSREAAAESVLRMVLSDLRHPDDRARFLNAWSRLNAVATSADATAGRARHGLRVVPDQLAQAGIAYVDAGNRAAAIGCADLIGMMDVRDRLAAYNAACLNARLRRALAALDLLRRAVDGGFTDADQLARDPDLESLRRDPEFMRLLARLREQAPAR